MVRGGVESRVRTTMTTEGEVDVMRGIQDMGAGTKRKEDPSSYNPGKKQKTYVSQGYPGQGRGHQDQGQDGTFSQAGQMMCYFCRQPGHFRQDCPQRQGSRGLGTVQSQSAKGQEHIQFVSPYPSMGQRDQCQYAGASQAPSTSQTGHIDQSQSTGRGLGQELQAESSGQAGQMTCYYCLQPGHMRRDYLRRQRSHSTETEHAD